MEEMSFYVLLAGGVVAAIVGASMSGKVRGKESAVGSDTGKAVADDDLARQVEDSRKDPDAQKTDISAAQAKAVANALYEAMSGVGTDEVTIEDLLVRRNWSNKAILSIIEAFGTRKYGTFGAPAFDWMGGEDLDLAKWLGRETSGELRNRLQEKFKQVNFYIGND